MSETTEAPPVDQLLERIHAQAAEPSALADVEAAAAAGDLERAREAAERHVAALKRELALARSLRGALKQLAAAAAAAPVARAPELDAIAAETDPWRQRRLWALAYARALAHADFELCGRLAAQELAFRSSLPILDQLIHEETDALLAGRPEEARGLLRFLAGTLAAGEPSEDEERHALAAVLVVIARLELDEYGDLDAERRAKLLFNRARAVAPDSGLPEAARALRFERKAEYGSATTRAQRAVRLSPERPEGYLALAMCAEAQLAPHAADYYAQVVERVLHENGDPRPGLALFAGALPHTLLVMLARRAAEIGRHELALELIDHALAPWATDEEREVQWRREAGEHRLRAEVLHTLGHDDLSAAALCDAIDRLNWAGETEEAVALAREANARDPELGRALWLLADALRVASTVTVPPYVDAERLGEAVDAWEAAKADPADVPEWALWVRASIEDGRSRLPGEDRAERLWQAVTLSEGGLLLDGDSAPTYAALAGYLRQLNRWPAALQASAQALEHDEGNALALEERLTLLANTGRYDEAGDVLNRLPPSPWLDSVRAFLLSRTGAPEQALELLLHAVAKTDRLSVWQQELKAYCLRELGRSEEARAEWEAIWSQRGAPVPDDRLGYAWAGWSLKKADEALAIAEPLCDDPIDRAEALRVSGLCELVLGRLEAAATHLRDGIRRSTGARTLGEFLELDLVDAEERAGEAGHDVCAQAREWVQERLAQLERHEGASQDLTEALADATQETGWAWVGALAGLARLSATDGAYREAADRYARLADGEARFPGAARGHAAAIESLRYAGDRRLLDGDAAGAAAEYAAALDAPGPLADGTRFELQCRASAALLEAGDAEGAGARFAEALASRDGQAIAEAVEPVLRDDAHRLRLADAWGGEAGARLLDSLEAALGGGQELRLAAMVLPLYVQVSDDVADPAAEDEFRRLLDEQAVRTAGTTGFRPPPPRIEIGRIGPGGYRVLVHEALAAAGRVDPAGVFCPGALLTSDDPVDLSYAWRDPLSGAPGAWISPERAAALGATAQSSLLTPQAFVARHFRAVLRDHLHRFLDVEAVEALLDRPSDRVEDYAQQLILLPDTPTRLRFARLIRELAREGVPIGTRDAESGHYAPDLHDLLVAAAEGALHAPRLEDALRTLRRRLRERLPGNDVAHRVRIPEAWEHAWPPDPESAFVQLATIRAYVAADKRPVALVTRDGALRPRLRELIAPELPAVPVLAMDELAEPDESLGEIALEDRSGVVA